MSAGLKTSGGGQAQALTADLCARAVIAAALAFGDDPVMACVAEGKSPVRRSLTASASGVARALDIPLKRVARVFGLNWKAIGNARCRGGPGYEAAERAAMRAVEFALWQAEARESVVGGEAADDVTASPSPSWGGSGEGGGGEAACESTAEPEGLPSPSQGAPSPGLPTPVAPLRTLPMKGREGAPPRAQAVTAESPLRDRILAVLADGSATAMGLASMLGAKELMVGQSLSGLASWGLVEAGEIPAEGRRQQRWSLV